VLVLPYSETAPLLDAVGPGGHLSLQQEAWQRLEGPRWLLWYRPAMPDGAVKCPPAPAAVGFIEALSADLSNPDLLWTRLQAIVAELRPPEPARARNPRAVVYVESNQIEIDEWLDLSRRLYEVWNDLLRDSTEAERVAMSALGLRVHELDREDSRLEKADGVVLLWGHKPKASLIEQVHTVEDLIQHEGPFAPCFIAYLIPPHGDAGRQPAEGWQVLRFRRDADGFREAEDESVPLRRILEDILRRKRQPASA
jgi:hypothetical protein